MRKRIKKMITIVLTTVLSLQTAVCSIKQEGSGSKEASDNRERGGFQEQESSADKGAASGQGQESSADKKAASAAAQHLLELWSDYLNLLDQM